MRNGTKRFAIAAAAIGLMTWAAGSAQAGTINVLWYDGGVAATGSGFATYDDAVNSLAAAAPGAPGGNTWNVTFWHGGAEPAGSFNTLVVTSPQGGWDTYPDYTSLAAAAPGITLGDRVMATGQDADWHYIHGPGPTNFDGPKGFLLDAINWSGSGTGLGAVFLGGSDLNGGFVLPGITRTAGSTNDVRIPAAYASFPINTDLTSAGLSNWSTSAHETWAITDPTKFTGINTDGPSTDNFVTVVSTSDVGGGISGSAVPEPSTFVMAGTFGVLGLLYRLRRRGTKVVA